MFRKGATEIPLGSRHRRRGVRIGSIICTDSVKRHDRQSQKDSIHLPHASRGNSIWPGLVSKVWNGSRTDGHRVDRRREPRSRIRFHAQPILAWRGSFAAAVLYGNAGRPSAFAAIADLAALARTRSGIACRLVGRLAILRTILVVA